MSMRLFTTVPGIGWNAELISNRSSAALPAYARAYFQASLVLLRRGADDLLIYPAVFTFRHGMELALKSLARDFQVVGEAEKLGRPSHLLGEIWAKVREPVEFYYGELQLASESKLSPVDLDGVICDLDRSDNQSMAFRYPSSLDGSPYLEELPVLDMAKFTSVAEQIANGLMVWVDWVAERAQNRRLKEWLTKSNR